MKTFRIFWILAAVAIIFGASVYFSKKKLEDLKNAPNQRVVVVDAPSPEPTVVQTPSIQENVPDTGSLSEGHGCVVMSEYKEVKSRLGKIVNSDKDQKSKDYLKTVDKFRLDYGLPFPIAISESKLNAENVIYNNCRSTCHGSVHEVFVSQIIKAKTIEVFQRDGRLKKLPLHESGLEVASVDELNKKGIPFRSWLAPVSESDWYIKGTDLYYSLDIPGLWLKIDPSSNWEVVSHPEDLSKLKRVEEPLRIRGCNNDEQCLESEGRHFKAPQICH